MKNRTHYVTYDDLAIDNQTVSGVTTKGEGNFSQIAVIKPLIEDSVCIVIDGVKYENVPYINLNPYVATLSSSSSIHAYGDAEVDGGAWIFNELPFVLLVSSDIAYLAFKDNNTDEHTVSLYLPTVHQLDEKYISYKPGLKVEGKIFSVYNTETNEYEDVVAKKGAEIFNSYESNTATGGWSHAEGSNTIASGSYSHAEGLCTIASGENQHVQGKFNIEDTENKYAHIVGNGTSSTRSNAHTVDWEGNAEYQGDVKANACGGENPISLVETANKTVMRVNVVELSTLAKSAVVTGQYQLDRTYTEMVSHIENGGMVVIYDDNSIIVPHNPMCYHLVYKYGELALVFGQSELISSDVTGLAYAGINDTSATIDYYYIAVDAENTVKVIKYTLDLSNTAIAALSTTDKTVVGSINELHDSVSSMKNQYAENMFTLTDKVNGYQYIVEMRNGQLTSYCSAESIKIETNPTTTTYSSGSAFDPTGIEVVAVCYDGTERIITDYTYDETVTSSTVTITYVENGKEFTTTLEVTLS